MGKFNYFLLLALIITNFSEAKKANKIQVQGLASTTLKAQKTNIQITIATQRKVANDALSDNNKYLADFQEKLKSVEKLNGKFKVFDQNFQINQQYSYNNRDRKFEGFKVSRSLLIQVEDPTLAGTVIDKAFISIPVNDEFNSIELNSVSPYVTKSVKEAEKIKLLSQCAVNAKLKAMTLASALGHSIGGALNINLNEHSNNMNFSGRNSMASFSMKESSNEASTELESQEIDLSISCDVDFAIEGEIK